MPQSCLWLGHCFVPLRVLRCSSLAWSCSFAADFPYEFSTMARPRLVFAEPQPCLRLRRCCQFLRWCSPGVDWSASFYCCFRNAPVSFVDGCCCYFWFLRCPSLVWGWGVGYLVICATNHSMYRLKPTVFFLLLHCLSLVCGWGDLFSSGFCDAPALFPNLCEWSFILSLLPVLSLLLLLPFNKKIAKQNQHSTYSYSIFTFPHHISTSTSTSQFCISIFQIHISTSTSTSHSHIPHFHISIFP